MNFNQSFNKCSILTPESRHQKTTYNLLRITLKADWGSVMNPYYRGSYVHKRMVKFSRAFQFFWCKFLKILMVSDKTIHKAFRIHKTPTVPHIWCYVCCLYLATKGIDFPPILAFLYNNTTKPSYNQNVNWNVKCHNLIPNYNFCLLL